MGVGFTDDSFIDEVVTLWDSIKKRRNRLLGLATGHHDKSVCMPNITAEADWGEPDVLMEVEGESLPNLDVWVHRVAQMRARENLAASGAAHPFEKWYGGILKMSYAWNP